MNCYVNFFVLSKQSLVPSPIFCLKSILPSRDSFFHLIFCLHQFFLLHRGNLWSPNIFLSRIDTVPSYLICLFFCSLQFFSVLPAQLFVSSPLMFCFKLMLSPVIHVIIFFFLWCHFFCVTRTIIGPPLVFVSVRCFSVVFHLLFLVLSLVLVLVLVLVRVFACADVFVRRTFCSHLPELSGTDN